MDILPIKIKLETIVPNLPAFGNQHTMLSDIETVVISNIGVHEADREKINHFLRKFILFFVSLFVTLFHFLKSDVTVAFYFTNYI